MLGSWVGQLIASMVWWSLLSDLYLGEATPELWGQAGCCGWAPCWAGLLAGLCITVGLLGGLPHWLKLLGFHMTYLYDLWPFHMNCINICLSLMEPQPLRLWSPSGSCHWLDSVFKQVHRQNLSDSYSGCGLLLGRGADFVLTFGRLILSLIPLRQDSSGPPGKCPGRLGELTASSGLFFSHWRNCRPALSVWCSVCLGRSHAVRVLLLLLTMWSFLVSVFQGNASASPLNLGIFTRLLVYE